jgi:hypothetical protein
VSWRALIAVAALLIVGIPGAAPSTSVARRASAPEILAAHARTSGGAEIRRGRQGPHAPSAAQPHGTGPAIIPSDAPTTRVRPAAVLLAAAPPADPPARRAVHRAAARAPPRT